MGYAPRAGPFGCHRFFRRFSVHFCVTLEHLFFKRQNVEGKSAGKSAQKAAHKNLGAEMKLGAEIGAKICCTKNLWVQKWAQNSAHQKSVHQKSAQKTSLNIPFVWKMEARKKNTHTHTPKKLCQTYAKPQPQEKRPAPTRGSLTGTPQLSTI